MSKRKGRESDEESSSQKEEKSVEGSETGSSSESESDSDSDSDSETEETILKDQGEVKKQYDHYYQDLIDDRTRILKNNDPLEMTSKIKSLRDVFGDIDTSNPRMIHLDSRTVMELTDQHGLQVRNINHGISRVKGINVDDFCTRLAGFLAPTRDMTVRYMELAEHGGEGAEQLSHRIDWQKLGVLSFAVSKRPPTNDFMIGPLAVEKRVVKQRAPRTVLKDITKAQEVAIKDISKEKTDTPTVVQNIYKKFDSYQRKKRRLSSKPQQITLFEFFINPDSYSQSIENLFYISFLIRDGKLEMTEDPETGYPMITLSPDLPKDPDDLLEEIERRKSLPANHIIFQLDYDTWEKLKKKFNITKCFIPNREPEANTRPQTETQNNGTGASWY